MHSKGGIIGWFAANPVTANLLMLLVVVLGLMETGALRREAFPSMEPESISISVAYNSGSAQLSEEGIAIKIEEQLEGVSGIREISSRSTGSSATVSVRKQSDYDLELLLQDIKARVDAISAFPVDAKKPVIEKAQRQEHALWLQLYGDVGRHTLQQLTEELKSDLMAQASINRVTVSGWLDPMMFVEIDESRLQAYGLSLSDIEDAVNAGSTSTLTAVMRNRDLYLQLQASEQAYRQQDFAAIPLLTLADGRQIRLGDVTSIRDSFDDTTATLSRFNGEDSIALQVVTTGMDDIADSVADARRVVEQWREQGRLPEGVSLTAWYDRSTSINERLQLLVKNAATGILFVFILLALFLNLSVAFWVAAGLPFIFFGTLYFMGDRFLGLSLNEFTTFGFILALGIVVDDAVVVGESIYETRRKQGDSHASTVAGTMKVAVPTLFGVFTTVAAFYSLSQVSGRLGELYSQFAMIVAICLVLSVVESKLILPAHLAHLKTRRRKYSHPLFGIWSRLQHGFSDGFDWFNDYIYGPAIIYALRYRYAVAVLFCALFMWVVAMPFNGTVRMSFFPDVSGDTVRAQVSMHKDVSYGLTHEALWQLEQTAYLADRELRRAADAGPPAINSLQVISSGDQSGSLTIELSKNAPYNINDFTRRWRELSRQPEGVRTLNIQSAMRMVSALDVQLRSNDEQSLSLAGAEIKAYLESVPAVFGIDDNLDPSQPQLHLALTPGGKAMGMTTASLARQVLQSFNGQVVQRYQRNKDEIEVKVRYPEESRQTPQQVLGARVRTPAGKSVFLSDVATVNFGYARDTITRIDGKRAVSITADVDKSVLSASQLVAMLKEFTPLLEKQYPGLEIQFGGEAEQQQETQGSMLNMFMLALLMIYLLLAIPLKSYIQPVLIMLAIPFGVVGAILGHWWNDIALGILSLNGIIALSGVVVNDSLLLVARFNQLNSRGEPVSEAVRLACHDRLRAVVLTSLTTFAGLMPLLNETSFQAQFLIPAAVSLAYGIMFATMITLILIPTLLLIQYDVRQGLTQLKCKALRKFSRISV